MLVVTGFDDRPVGVFSEDTPEIDTLLRMLGVYHRIGHVYDLHPNELFQLLREGRTLYVVEYVEGDPPDGAQRLAVYGPAELFEDTDYVPKAEQRFSTFIDDRKRKMMIAAVWCYSSTDAENFVEAELIVAADRGWVDGDTWAYPAM